MSERKARRKVAEFQTLVAQGKNPITFSKKSPVYTKTFKDAADRWFNSINNTNHLAETTISNYQKQLYNQALPFIGANTLLSDLVWTDEETQGKETIMDMVTYFRKGRTGEQARKILGVCRQVFNHAIESGWMKKRSNPCQLPEHWKQVKSHNPTITWEEVPKLIEDINLNKCDGTYEVQTAVRFMLMSFLRASTVVCLKWSWIKEVDGIKCFVIPPDTPGMKKQRIKVRNGEIDPHYLPITEEMQVLLDDIKVKTGHSEYVFLSSRGKKYPHVCPDAPNKHLRELGYKDKLTAHGWRSVALTAGQDVFNFSHDLIQRQMGHEIGDKVRKAYDRSKQLSKRLEFLNVWCNSLADMGL
jgi:integrase